MYYVHHKERPLIENFRDSTVLVPLCLLSTQSDDGSE